MATPSQELNRRLQLWASLSHLNDQGIAPQVLRTAGVYGGAQGIWVDKARTGDLTKEGVTVGILHLGRHCPDDLSSDGLIYHYPVTRRRPPRDASEVQATKNALSLHLPIFVISPNEKNRSLRSVELGWVSDFDDEEKQFLILFGNELPQYEKPTPADAVFSLLSPDDRREAKTKRRPSQAQFRFQVLSQYGLKCAACGIDHPSLIKAAHIRGRGEMGSDGWRNGLPLCSTHHDAFDAHLFGIEPDSFRLTPAPGVSPANVGLAENIVRTKRGRHPHKEALDWRWKNTLKAWNAQEAKKAD